jgi:hypothetical protein
MTKDEIRQFLGIKKQWFGCQGIGIINSNGHIILMSLPVPYNIVVLEDVTPVVNKWVRSLETKDKTIDTLYIRIKAHISRAQNVHPYVYQASLGQSKITVKDGNKNPKFTITKKDVKEWYKDLNLKSHVIEAIMQAHKIVLEHGFQTGNERVIAVDNETGEYIANEPGEEIEVKFSFLPEQVKRLTVIHNHPNNSMFSPRDLYAFGSTQQIQCLVAHGHNSNLCVLRKYGNNYKTFNYKLNALNDFFDDICLSSEYKHMSITEKAELFIRIVSNEMNWDFFVRRCNYGRTQKN